MTEEEASNLKAERSTADLPNFKAILFSQRESGKNTPLFFSLIGLEEISLHALKSRVEDGFEYERLERLQETVDLTNQRVAELIQVPLTTLIRRRQKGRLEPAESDRLVRIARIIGQAIELFEGDASGAKRWLDTPNPSLNGESPFDVSKTEIGGRMVEDLILRLDHGVYD